MNETSRDIHINLGEIENFILADLSWMTKSLCRGAELFLSVTNHLSDGLLCHM